MKGPVMTTTKPIKIKYEAIILIGNEKIQHVVAAENEEQVRERIKRAYKGKAKIYRIDIPGKRAMSTGLWNED